MASQNYLRAGVGVVIGVVLLGESLSVPVALGLAAALLGVALINFRPSVKPPGFPVMGKGA